MAVRSPEKAGVGGSIPSLATMFSITYKPLKPRICSILFQYSNQGSPRFVSLRSGSEEGICPAKTVVDQPLISIHEVIHEVSSGNRRPSQHG